MLNFTKKEIEHIKIFQKSIYIEEIDGYGNIFINYSGFVMKRKILSFYIEYIEKVLLEALEVSKKNKNKQYICHIIFKNIEMKNISYNFCKMAVNKIENNKKLHDTLKEAKFYCKNKISKGIFLIIYNLLDKDTKKKYKLICD